MHDYNKTRFTTFQATPLAPSLRHCARGLYQYQIDKNVCAINSRCSSFFVNIPSYLPARNADILFRPITRDREVFHCTTRGVWHIWRLYFRHVNTTLLPALITYWQPYPIRYRLIYFKVEHLKTLNANWCNVIQPVSDET